MAPTKNLRVATWNINNRVGRVRFHPEAATAAAALGADVVVITEFFPGTHESSFLLELELLGYQFHLLSNQGPQTANRILAVSRYPLERVAIPMPQFDYQFPSNLLPFAVAGTGINILGIRVPAYKLEASSMLFQAWDWVEITARSWSCTPSIILGDLNVSVSSRSTRAGDHFRRILSSGWRRAHTTPAPTYYGNRGNTSEIDHILVSDFCGTTNPEVVLDRGGFAYAGNMQALSDHAALICDVMRRHHTQ